MDYSCFGSKGTKVFLLILILMKDHFLYTCITRWISTAMDSAASPVSILFRSLYKILTSFDYRFKSMNNFAPKFLFSIVLLPYITTTSCVLAEMEYEFDGISFLIVSNSDSKWGLNGIRVKSFEILYIQWVVLYNGLSCWRELHQTELAR